MRILFICGTLVIFAATATTAVGETPERDPGASIRIKSLDNGLRVVYAPSENAKTVQILMRVNAGRWSEEKAGVAHLLEHYIFKDARMKADMTYLEVIEENGGSGNAFVVDENTTFYATVPPSKADWLLGIFGRMLINKEFIDKDVEFAKKPVYLEIGRPGPLDYLAAAFSLVFPSNFDLFPGFWETEFNQKSPRRHANMPDTITTASLTSGDLKTFYDTYYHAQNMTLFIAGRFQRDEMEARVKQIFGAMEKGATQGPVPGPLTARHGEYIRSNSTSGTPRFEIGTKLADISFEEQIAVDMYLGALSHQLMKELRNSRGETYTVSPRLDIRRKNGYGSVQMEAPPEAYNGNLKLVRERIDSETRQGRISPEQFEQAKLLYARRFDLKDKDSGAMMDLAKKAEQALVDYGPGTPRPYQIYSSMSLEHYKALLKNAFAPKMQLERRSEPPLFFRYEGVLLLLIGAAAWPWLARRVFTREFPHDRIRMVRKLQYPPGFLIQTLCVVTALAFFIAALAALCAGWNRIDSLQSSFIMSDYLFMQISLGLLIFISQAWFGLFGRKVMIVDQHLWIKSLGYRSTTIPLRDIVSAESIRPPTLFLHPRRLWQIKWRFHIYSPISFWRKAWLIETRARKMYLLGLAHTPNVPSELARSEEPPQPDSAAGIDNAPFSRSG
jgi:predicted Zn-dependent peptidase